MASSESYKRGQQIISADLAAARAKRLLPLDDFGLTWGGLVLPSTEAVTHFCVVGATGSGKTTLLRLLMQSCLPLIGASFREKTHEITHTKTEEPSRYEQDSYDRDVAAYNEQVARRAAALKKNQQDIDAAKEQNKRIQADNARTSARIAELDKELAAVKFVEVSTEDIKFSLVMIFMFACLLPYLPAFSTLIPWQGQILIMVGLGLAFLVLFIPLLSKSGERNRHNDLAHAQIDVLTQQKKLWSLVPEVPEPSPLHWPYIPAVTATRPVPKTTETTQTIHPNRYSGPGHRAMIYDAKGDIVSLLYGMGITCPIEILNPFDKRSSAWNIAKDITTPASARQFATILIPEDKNASQPFFANSARDVIEKVMLSLIQLKPGSWTLRDLILATQTKEHIVGILEKTAQGKVKIETYFSDDRTGSNILSEIATRMAPFESVAQAWSSAERSVSLTDWVKGESILVLGNNEAHRAAHDPINRVIFQRATELTLDLDESDTRRVWFFLDEVRDMGSLESLGRLMTKGRSKGVSVVLGFQDIEGMHDAFGKERANEFIGQCANKAILGLNSPETAKWASELFGKYEFMEEETGENKGGSKTTGATKTTGETTGDTETTGTSEGTSFGTSKGFSLSEGTSRGGSETSGQSSSSTRQWGEQEGKQTSEQKSDQISKQDSKSLAKQTSTQSSNAENTSDSESWTQTINKKRMEKDALLSSQFTTLPRPNPRNGLHGYYLVPSVGAFYGILDSAYVKNSLLGPDRGKPNYLPRPDSDQYLQMWTEDELKALSPATAAKDSKGKTAKAASSSSSASTGSNLGDSISGQSNTKSKSVQLPRNIRWLPDTDPDSGLTRL